MVADSQRDTSEGPYVQKTLPRTLCCFLPQSSIFHSNRQTAGLTLTGHTRIPTVSISVCKCTQDGAGMQVRGPAQANSWKQGRGHAVHLMMYMHGKTCLFRQTCPVPMKRCFSIAAVLVAVRLIFGVLASILTFTTLYQLNGTPPPPRLRPPLYYPPVPPSIHHHLMLYSIIHVQICQSASTPS